MKKMTIVFALTNLLLCNITFAETWTITQLTDNSTDDLGPSISGTNVVWMGWDGSDYEIYSNFAGQLIALFKNKAYKKQEVSCGFVHKFCYRSI